MGDTGGKTGKTWMESLLFIQCSLFPVRLSFRITYFLSREVVGGQQSSYKTDVDLKHGYLCVLERTETKTALFMFVKDIRAQFLINVLHPYPAHENGKSRMMSGKRQCRINVLSRRLGQRLLTRVIFKLIYTEIKRPGENWP